MDTLTITLPSRAARKVRREAMQLGLTPEEYLLELVEQGLDPEDRALDYIEAARILLAQAYEELAKGDLRQAAEKAWGATALAVKAYAMWRDKKRLGSHRELWRYKDKIVKELGDWVRSSWNAGNSMHTCFYEGWCTEEDVKSNLREVERLVKEIEKQIRANKQ